MAGCFGGGGGAGDGDGTDTAAGTTTAEGATTGTETTAAGTTIEGEATTGEGATTEEETTTEGAATTQQGTKEIIDLAGRTVAVPAEIEDLIAVGPGALRIIAQVGAVDRVVGIEESETTFLTEAPYNIAYPSIREKPVIGGDTISAEQIVAQEPDAVFSTSSQEELNTLQQQTGIPTIGIGTGELINIGAPLLEDVWSFVGRILDKEDETAEVVSFLEATKADYTERTADVSADDLPSVYIAAISFRGGQGFSATRPLFASFELLGEVNNVAADLDYEEIPHVTISPEQLLQWDPQIIFVDRGNLELVREDINKNPEYRELTAIQNGNVYGILPHAQYALNHGSILANTYYMGTVMYSEAFDDIAVEQRAKEIYGAIYGQPVYEKLVELYGGLEPIDLS